MINEAQQLTRIRESLQAKAAASKLEEKVQLELQFKARCYGAAVEIAGYWMLLWLYDNSPFWDSLWGAMALYYFIRLFLFMRNLPASGKKDKPKGKK